MKIVNFTDYPIGTLVKHSKHWMKESGYKPDVNKIGILVGKSFFNDSLSGIVCWPDIHWENAPMSHLCHPVNVTPFRKTNHPLRWIEIAGDNKKPS